MCRAGIGSTDPTWSVFVAKCESTRSFATTGHVGPVLPVDNGGHPRGRVYRLKGRHWMRSTGMCRVESRRIQSGPYTNVLMA